MFFKKPPHRVFDYSPRFYNPNEDQDEKRKKKLKFHKHRKFGPKKGTGIKYAIILLLAYLLYLKLTGQI